MRGYLAAFAAIAAAFAVPAMAADENVVAAAPLYAVLDETSIKLGEARTIKKGDLVVRYQLIHPPAIKLKTALNFVIAEKAVSLEAGQELSLFQADYRMAPRLKSRSIIFCGKRRYTFATAFLGSMSRYGLDVRICLLDQDDDKKFETAFLGGAKRVEDKAMLTIDPVEYEMLEPAPSDGEHLDIRFGGYPMLSSGTGFTFEIFEQGKDLRQSMFYLDWGRGFVEYSAYANLKAKKNLTSFPLRIGSAAFNVISRDREVGSVTLRFDAKPMPMVVFAADVGDVWTPLAIPFDRLDR